MALEKGNVLFTLRSKKTNSIKEEDSMKKIFLLTHDRHKPARVVDLTKSDIRKYIKRERRHELPEEVDFLAFDCKFGFGEETPFEIHEAEFNKYIDQAVEKECKSVYVEILGRPGFRQKREVVEEASEVSQIETEPTGE